VFWWSKPEIAIYVGCDRVLARVGRRGIRGRVKALVAAQVALEQATPAGVGEALSTVMEQIKVPRSTRVTVYLGGAHLEAGCVQGGVGATPELLRALAQREVRLSRGDDAPMHHVHLISTNRPEQTGFVASEAALLTAIRQALSNAGVVTDAILPWVAVALRTDALHTQVIEPGAVWILKDAPEEAGIELHHTDDALAVLADAARRVPSSSESANSAERIVFSFPAEQRLQSPLECRSAWLTFADALERAT
jgi:hypothetical protein